MRHFVKTQLINSQQRDPIPKSLHIETGPSWKFVKKKTSKTHATFANTGSILSLQKGGLTLRLTLVSQSFYWGAVVCQVLVSAYTSEGLERGITRIAVRI